MAEATKRKRKLAQRGGSLKRKRNKLNNLLSPLARVQFLSPTPQGSVSTVSDVCLFPLCLVGMVQGDYRRLCGVRTTEGLYHGDRGKQKCGDQIGIQECVLNPGHIGKGGMRPLS